MNKKKITALLTGLSILFCASGVITYAMPETSVTNHFETGIVDITLKEYQLVNGTEVEYEDKQVLLPGMTVSRIPRIYNNGNDCYIRAKVAFSNMEDLSAEDINGISDEWVYAIDGYWYYTKILKTGEDVDIFTGFSVPADFPQTEEGKEFSLDIDVDAIQSRNFTPSFSSSAPWGSVNIVECINQDGHDVSALEKAQNLSFSITYDGESSKLFTNADDFFAGFPYLMPGDTFSDKANLKNNSSNDIYLYMRASNENDSALLDMINLTITTEINGNTKEIYSGKLRAESLSTNILLGTIPPQASGALKFEISVPEELDNNYADLSSSVKWFFSTEPITVSTSVTPTPTVTGSTTSPSRSFGSSQTGSGSTTSIAAAVKTGDHTQIGMFLGIMGIAFGVAAFAYGKKEGIKNEHQ